MRRRRRPRYGQLTSLVDVLFILLFASLVQQRRSSAATAENLPQVQQAEHAEVDAGLPDAGADDARSASDQLATARIISGFIDSAETILVTVNRFGTVVSIEASTSATLAVEIPLLRATGDSQVVVYDVDGADGGDAGVGHRLCPRLARALGRLELHGALIIISTEVALRAAGYALVRGLRRDAARCADDTGAHALLLRGSASDSK